MKFLGRILVSVVSNSIAILAADYFLAGFIFAGTFLDLIIAATVLALINAFVRPIFKLLFGPLIVLTFGFFVIVINALTLYLLDIFTAPLLIKGSVPLLIATLIFGVVNVLINISSKLAYRR